MGIKGRKNITEKDFDNIKRLTEMKISRSNIAKITERTYNTIARVQNSPSWAKYSAYKQDMASRMKAKHLGVRGAATPTHVNEVVKPFETLLLEAIRDINATLQAKLPQFKDKFLK